MRSVADGASSGWTETLEVRVEPVAAVDAMSVADELPAGLLLRTLWQGLVHLVHDALTSTK